MAPRVHERSLSVSSPPVLRGGFPVPSTSRTSASPPPRPTGPWPAPASPVSKKKTAAMPSRRPRSCRISSTAFRRRTPESLFLLWFLRLPVVPAFTLGGLVLGLHRAHVECCLELQLVGD